MKENILIKNYINTNKLNIEQIMKDFTPYIYTIIKNRNSYLAEGDIEEIISDVFLAIWKNQEKLDINMPISSYIAGITHNLLNKKIRNLNNRINVTELNEYIYSIENVEIETENKERYKLIMDYLNKMKKDDKYIFLLYYYYSKSIKEIGKQLNISEEKVKSRLFRIRKKLKKELERKGYNYNG